MRTQIIAFIVLIGFVFSQDGRPFEITVTPRYVDEKRIVVNVQLTNLTNKPLDYLEGFLLERDSSRKLLDEKRVVLTAGMNPRSRQALLRQKVCHTKSVRASLIHTSLSFLNVSFLESPKYLLGIQKQVTFELSNNLK